MEAESCASYLYVKNIKKLIVRGAFVIRGGEVERSANANRGYAKNCKKKRKVQKLPRAQVGGP